MTIEVRIRKSPKGQWLAVKLLQATATGAKVDDGNGPIHILAQHVHPADRRIDEAKR